MAATKGLNPVQQEKIREQIRTTQLVKRLQFYALGEADPAETKRTGEETPVEIDAGRLKAIETLLRKSLPDLSAVQIDATHDVADPVLALFEQVAEAAGAKRIGTGEGS